MKLIFCAAAFLLACLVSSCSREECPNRSAEGQRESVYRYVEGSSLPALKGVARDDIRFLDDTRYYSVDSRIWRWHFLAKEREYIALISCDGSVELSIAENPLVP